MGQTVVTETGITSTVSHQLFRYWTCTVACDSHICAQNLIKIGQELTILENGPSPKNVQPPALGKVIEPRSHTQGCYNNHVTLRGEIN